MTQKARKPLVNKHLGAIKDVIWAVTKTRSEAVAEAKIEPGGPPSRAAGGHGNAPKVKKTLAKTSIPEPKRGSIGVLWIVLNPGLVFLGQTDFLGARKKTSHMAIADRNSPCEHMALADRNSPCE